MVVKDNTVVQKELLEAVISQFLDKKTVQTSVKCGRLEINDFSICFGIDYVRKARANGLYVKIPKIDLLFKKGKNILPISDADRKFAEAEYDSLIYLSRCWNSDNKAINFVKPVGFIGEYNAVVMERVGGRDFFRKFRKWDMLRKLRLNWCRDWIHTLLFELGRTLCKFHKASEEGHIFRVDETLRKIEYYFSTLNKFKIDSKFLNTHMSKILRFKGYSSPAQITNTLKGLDIRNMIVDKEGGSSCLILEK